MSSAIDLIVSVSITNGTITVQQTSFGIPAIIAEFATGKTSTAFTRLRSYSSAADLVADGWATTDPVYAAVMAALSQSPAVKYVYVGRRDATDADWETALNAIQLEGDGWYGLTIIPIGTTTDAITAELLQVAAWVESQKKVSILETNDANVLLSSSTTDAASQLKALKYKRTLCLYRAASHAGEYAAAAWLGKVLPYTPGAANWAYKTLSGVTADGINVSQKLVAQSKRANTYSTIAGVDVTEQGVVGSGEFADVTEGLDWVESNLQTTVFAALASQAKIAYDDGGIEAVANLVLSVLRKAASMGILQGDSITVTVPEYADIATADKTARNLPDVKFTALVEGAINTIQISGTVSV